MLILSSLRQNADDDIVERIALECGVKVFRGSENNVLSRFYYAAKENNIDIISRVTCDDLLLDPRWLFDDLLDEFIADGTYDYYTCMEFDEKNNKWNENEPCSGLNVEIFSFKALERSFNETENPYCIEHVTPYFYMNPDLFRCGGHGSGYPGPNILPEKYGTSLDTKEDLELLRNIYNELYPKNSEFTVMDVIEAYQRHPEWISIVSEVVRTPVTYRGEGNKNTGWDWH